MELPKEIRDKLNAWVALGPLDAHRLVEIVKDTYELGYEDGKEEAMETVSDWYTPETESNRNE